MAFIFLVLAFAKRLHFLVHRTLPRRTSFNLQEHPDRATSWHIPPGCNTLLYQDVRPYNWPFNTVTRCVGMYSLPNCGRAFARCGEHRNLRSRPRAAPGGFFRRGFLGAAAEAAARTEHCL
jgi:hypothetical protein